MKKWLLGFVRFFKMRNKIEKFKKTKKKSKFSIWKNDCSISLFLCILNTQTQSDNVKNLSLFKKFLRTMWFYIFMYFEHPDSIGQCKGSRITQGIFTSSWNGWNSNISSRDRQCWNNYWSFKYFWICAAVFWFRTLVYKLI